MFNYTSKLCEKKCIYRIETIKRNYFNKYFIYLSIKELMLKTKNCLIIMIVISKYKVQKNILRNFFV